MNKVDTISLANMLLPRTDASKSSMTDSAFKDIFSLSNSNNSSNKKNDKTTNDFHSDKYKNEPTNAQPKEIKESKSEPLKQTNNQQSKKQDEVNNYKQTEDKLSSTNESDSKNIDTAKAENKEAEGIIDTEKIPGAIEEEATKQIIGLVQVLVNVELKPEQLVKLNEIVDSLPNEIKQLILEDPRLALDFLKDNLAVLAKELNLTGPQVIEVDDKLKSLIGSIASDKNFELPEIANLQKMLTQTSKASNEPEAKPNISNNIMNNTDLNLEINALKINPNTSSQSSFTSANGFSESQSKALEFIQTDKIEGFDLTGGKIFSSSILLNSGKQVEVRSNQFLQMINKIANEIRLTVDKNKTEMTIKLQPETLGKLTVKISSENGVMNASFFAENDKAKALIERNMMELKASLESQGIQVQNLTVTVDQNQDELTRHRNIKEAQKYNKAHVNVLSIDDLDENILDNPYILDDIFTELI